MDKMNSIKTNVTTVLKESMKFALVAVTILWTLGLLMIYYLTYILKYDVEESVVVSGLIVVILIVTVDLTVFHTMDKIIVHNRKIIKIVLSSKEVN